jgi:hypothetical protein
VEFQAIPEVAVLADVAESITSVKYVPKRKNCELEVAQVHNLASGVIAGGKIKVDAPTVGIHSRIWGPDIETSTPIFTKTLLHICTASKKPTNSKISMTATNRNRRDLTTTASKSEITGGTVSCLSTDTASCATSLQETTNDVYKRLFSKVASSAAKPTIRVQRLVV